MSNNYKYFLYSDEQIKEKNDILNKRGKVFVPGTIIIRGTRKKFTQISSEPTLPRFVDTQVIAEGNPEEFIYTEPTTSVKRGN